MLCLATATPEVGSFSGKAWNFGRAAVEALQMGIPSRERDVHVLVGGESRKRGSNRRCQAHMPQRRLHQDGAVHGTTRHLAEAETGMG